MRKPFLDLTKYERLLDDDRYMLQDAWKMRTKHPGSFESDYYAMRDWVLLCQRH